MRRRTHALLGELKTLRLNLLFFLDVLVKHRLQLLLERWGHGRVLVYLEMGT